MKARVNTQQIKQTQIFANANVQFSFYSVRFGRPNTSFEITIFTNVAIIIACK